MSILDANIAKQEKEETEGDSDSVILSSTNPQLLCCIICSKHLRPPVYQCKNGHLACSCCYTEKHRCGTHCDLLMSNEYQAIDLILETLGIQCPNKQYGCMEMIKLGEEYKHEIVCRFTLCPFEGCKIVDSPENLYITHMISHGALYLKEDESISVELKRNDKFLFLVHPGFSLFHIVNKIAFLLCNWITEVGNVVSVCTFGYHSRSFKYEIKIHSGSSLLSSKCSVKCHKSISEMVKFPTKEYMLIPSWLFGSTDRLDLDLKISDC